MSDPIVKRGTIRNVIGVEVDEISVSLLCNSDTLVGNMPLAQFARQGGFDGARLVVTRSFSASHASSACGTLHLFSGRVGPLTISGSEVAMTIKSDLELLDIMMPRNTYQASCMHTLYDSGCNLSAATFTVTGNTTGGSTTSVVNSNLAQADGYFSLGVMQFTSGQNNQVARSVKVYANGSLTPVQPLPFAPAAGDHFTVRPGCDKQQATCNVKFSNLLNFRGFPFIPTPEASY